MRPWSQLLPFSLVLVAGCASQSAQPPVGEAPPALPPPIQSPAGHVRAGSGDFLGCSYPSGKVYQTSILNAGLDPNSAAYIKAMNDGGGGTAFLATMPTYEYINMADNQTPMLTVHPLVGYIVPFSPVPWEADFYISQLSDAHSLVLQAQKCKYYEGYGTSYSPSQGLTMYNDTHINLKGRFRRPPTGALSTSSGIPLGLLAVRPEEFTAGVISHALGWNIVSGSVSQTACVSPAGRTQCTNGAPFKGPASDTPMPWGAHARLKNSFNISNFHTEAKILATAMKTYGMYVYDAGCCNEVLFTNDVNGAPVWTGYDADDLETISPSDLEIVPPPKR
jgi:hypothetical protein